MILHLFRGEKSCGWCCRKSFFFWRKAYWWQVRKLRNFWYVRDGNCRIWMWLENDSEIALQGQSEAENGDFTEEKGAHFGGGEKARERMSHLARTQWPRRSPLQLKVHESEKLWHWQWQILRRYANACAGEKWKKKEAELSRLYFWGRYLRYIGSQGPSLEMEDLWEL